MIRVCLIVLLVLCINGCSKQNSSDPTTIDATELSSLEEARTSSRAKGKTVIVSTTLSEEQSNITEPWPSDRSLKIVMGGKISNTTEFVINGPFQGPGLTQCFAGTAVVRFGSESVAEVFPEWWGAKGDGVAYDGNAIDLAAKAGKAIVLSSGSAYVLERTVCIFTLLKGCGATIKRPEVNFDIPVSSGMPATAITVDITNKDYCKLFVGSSVTFINKPGTTRKVDYMVRTITAIDGEKISLSSLPPENLPYIPFEPNTSHMTNQYPLLKLFPGAEISGVTFNGSRGKYDPSRAYWETGSTVSTGIGTISDGYSSGNALIKDCIFYDSIGDAIIVGGQTTVDNNRFFRSGYAAIHLSGTEGAKVINNYIFDSNLNSNPGLHSFGGSASAIEYSGAVYDTYIAGNTIDTCENGIGYINSSWDSKSIIIGNTIKNFKNDGISFKSVPQDGLTNITRDFTIYGNQFLGSNRGVEPSQQFYTYIPTIPNKKATLHGIGIYEFQNPLGRSNLYKDIVIIGNSFLDCGVSIQNTDGFVLSGNSFDDGESYAFDEPTPSELISILDSVGVISGNNIKSTTTGVNARKSIFSFFSFGVHPVQITISGNNIRTAMPLWLGVLNSGINISGQYTGSL